nr:DUF6538 domain-containing protein [Paracoccus sp. SM22M-07]
MGIANFIFHRGAIYTWRRRIPKRADSGAVNLQVSFRTACSWTARRLAVIVTAESEKVFDRMGMDGLPPAVPPHFPADGGRCPGQIMRDCTQGQTSRKPARDLFPLAQRQCDPGSDACRGLIPPVRARWGKFDEDARPKLRPIEPNDSPRCHRSHISDFCTSV